MDFSAAVLTRIGQPLEIVERIIIPKLKTGQVLVKIAYSGVCHSQLMEQSGHRGPDRYLPHMLGHEGTGEVVDIGEGVTTVKSGDKVILGWLKGDGMDVQGAIYDSPIGKINSGAVTTFSQYSVVSENRCYSLPTNISMQEGVLLGCALPTGMGIVKNQIKPTLDSTLGIVGLGGIGMAALIAANCLPHKLIVAIDTNEEKLKIAKNLGADACINPRTEDVHEQIALLTDNKMLDKTIEAAGSCKTIELAFSLINKKSGDCVFASHPPAGQKIQLDPFELICGKTITGSWGGGSHPTDICKFVSNHKSEVNLTPFLSDFYSLNDINSSLKDLQQQKVVRAIIEMSH